MPGQRFISPAICSCLYPCMLSPLFLIFHLQHNLALMMVLSINGKTWGKNKNTGACHNYCTSILDNSKTVNYSHPPNKVARVYYKCRLACKLSFFLFYVCCCKPMRAFQCLQEIIQNFCPNIRSSSKICIFLCFLSSWYTHIWNLCSSFPPSLIIKYLLSLIFTYHKTIN